MIEQKENKGAREGVCVCVLGESVKENLPDIWHQSLKAVSVNILHSS